MRQIIEAMPPYTLKIFKSTLSNQNCYWFVDVFDSRTNGSQNWASLGSSADYIWARALFERARVHVAKVQASHAFGLKVHKLSEEIDRHQIEEEIKEGDYLLQILRMVKSEDELVQSY